MAASTTNTTNTNNMKASRSGTKPAHVPVRSASSSSWNPIKFIERKLFETYWQIEATYALSMLEAWEVFLVIMVFCILSALTWYSLIHYFPRHIQLVARRAIYYVYGTYPSANSSTSSLASTTANDAVQALSSLSSSALQQINETSTSLFDKLIQSSSLLWSSLEKDASADPATILKSNPEIVDNLINNLNNLKQMATEKVDL